MAKTRRSYTGASVSTITQSDINASGTSSFTVESATNWPYGADPFYVVLSPSTASEEKILVTRTNTGDTTLEISSDVVRGLDGTSAVFHGSGATVYPVFTAVDADEANELASMWEAKGDIVSHGASTFARLAVGSDDTVLIADASASSGLAWGQVNTANIANDAVTNAKIATGAVDTAELASNAVTEGKLDSAVVSKLLPAGTIAATIKSSADVGWALMGTTITNAQTDTPALWAVAPTSWRSGSNLVLPSMANKYLSGKGTSETLGAEGGSNTKTLAAANLPKHTHTLSAHTHTMNDHQHTINHNHGAETFTVSGTVGGNTTKFVYNTESYNTTPYIATDRNEADYYSASDFGMAVANVTTHDHSWSGTVTVDLANTTGLNSGTNNEATDGPSNPDTGNGGTALTATAFNVESLHMIVNFQIKAH